MAETPLAERIARFVDDPSADDFGALARAAFRALHSSDEAFRRLCDRVAATPESVGSWAAIPAVEASAEPWADAQTGSYTVLQRRAIERGLWTACRGDLDRPPLVQLVPASDAAPDRELTRLCSELAQRLGGDGSASAVAGARVDVSPARSWLAARQRDRRPAVLLASDSSMERLLGALERQDLKFQLAFGSRVVVARMLAESGSVEHLGGRCAERLGVAPDRVIRQARWPGVPTPVYGSLTDADPPPPHWLRLDPRTALDLTITDRPFRIAREADGGGA